VIFLYATAAAVALIGLVAHYYLPTTAAAAEAQAEYAALRGVSPILILAEDGGSVHVCINSSAPQKVYVWRDTWVEAQGGCPGGGCLRCRWYVGRFKPGDRVAILLRSPRAAVVKNYTVSAIPVRNP